MERQLDDLLGRQIVGERRVHESRRDGALAQRGEIHAGAVVADGDADRVLLARRLDAQIAHLGLAGLRRALPASRGRGRRRCAPVDERVVEAVEDRAVEFELGAGECHLDALAGAHRHFARDARKILHHAQQRRRAQRERAPLQLADHAIHLVEAAGEARVLADPVGFGGGAQLAGGEDHLAHRAEKAVERLVRDPHGRRRSGYGRAHRLDVHASGRRARRSLDYDRRSAFFGDSGSPSSDEQHLVGRRRLAGLAHHGDHALEALETAKQHCDALAVVDPAALAPGAEPILESMRQCR